MEFTHCKIYHMLFGLIQFSFNAYFVYKPIICKCIVFYVGKQMKKKWFQGNQISVICMDCWAQLDQKNSFLFLLCLSRSAQCFYVNYERMHMRSGISVIISSDVILYFVVLSIKVINFLFFLLTFPHSFPLYFIWYSIDSACYTHLCLAGTKSTIRFLFR